MYCLLLLNVRRCIDLIIKCYHSFYNLSNLITVTSRQHFQMGQLSQLFLFLSLSRNCRGNSDTKLLKNETQHADSVIVYIVLCITAYVHRSTFSVYFPYTVLKLVHRVVVASLSDTFRLQVACEVSPPVFTLEHPLAWPYSAPGDGLDMPIIKII